MLGVKMHFDDPTDDLHSFPSTAIVCPGPD